MSFSEKFGLKKEMPLQINSMTPELRSALWNPVYLSLWDQEQRNFSNRQLLLEVWVDLFDWHIEDLPHNIQIRGVDYKVFNAKERIKVAFLEFAHNEVYDVIACIAAYYASKQDPRLEMFSSLTNKILEKHNSAYRLSGAEIIKIIDPALISSIETIRSDSNIPDNVKEELSKAITKLSERGEIEKPYIYNESARDAIHMLEAYLREKTGESTLSKAIKDLKKNNKIPTTLFNILDGLYAFSNDQLRHGLKLEPKQVQLEYSDALYILHLSLSLINYLEYPGKLFQLIDQFTGVS